MRRCVLPILVILLLSGCVTTPPSNSSDVCSIFREKNGWYNDADKAARRWGTPIPVQMSFIYQESQFDGSAKPPRRRLLWIIPWTRISSAAGYAQALKSTWKEYKSEAGGFMASRSDFGDSVDFIGWYINKNHRRLNIPKSDAYRQYLAYYVGAGGYEKGTYRNKPWLEKTARRVNDRASKYKRQLAGCRAELEAQSPWWWPF